MYTVHQTVLVKQTDLIDFHFPDCEIGEDHHTGQRDHDTTAHLKRLVVLQGPITLTLFLYWVIMREITMTPKSTSKMSRFPIDNIAKVNSEE